MKKYLVWPAFLFLLAILFVIYTRITGCSDGFSIGSCVMGKLAIISMILIALLFYLISVSFMFFRARAKGMTLSQKTIMITGVVTLLFIPFISLADRLVSFLTLLLVFPLGNLLGASLH